MALAELINILITAIALVSFFYLPAIKMDLNFADEGYLWYGSLKVLEGKIPIRDFRAYDPGRYYWCAIWMKLFGLNLLSIRIGLIVIQILSLAVCMSLVYLVTEAWYATIIMGFAMVSWLYPLHKQIDTLFSITTPLIAVLLVNTPTALLYNISGMYVGICFLFGLNHGVYASGSLILLIITMMFHNYGLTFIDLSAELSIGLGLGLIPLLSFFILPGFFNIYWQLKVSKILQRGTANLPLPKPWWWTSEQFQLMRKNKGGQFLTKFFFNIFPIVIICVLTPTILGFSPNDNREWSLFAIACCGLFYWHHVLSRADFSHLSQSIAPILMILVILLSGIANGWIVMVLLTGGILSFIYSSHIGRIRHLFRIGQLEKFKVNKTTLWFSLFQAQYLKFISKLINQYSFPEDSVALLPNLVTLYPLMERSSAVYDLFCVYPATNKEEEKMIQELSDGVTFVLINNSAIDRQDRLRFSKTHPKVWSFLKSEFQVLNEEGMPDNHYAYVKNK